MMKHMMGFNGLLYLLALLVDKILGLLLYVARFSSQGESQVCEVKRNWVYLNF